MSKIVRVVQEIEFLKPRLEEILTRATTLFNTRFPTDDIEQTCDDAQDTLDILRHRTQKYSNAFREFQALADTIAEADGLFRKIQGAMRNLLLDAEELALRLDKKLVKYLKDYLEKRRKRDRALPDELERKQAEMEAEKARAQLEMKQRPEKLVFVAEQPEKVSASAEQPEKVAVAVEQPEKVGVAVEQKEGTRMHRSMPPSTTEPHSLSHSLPSMRATLTASPAAQSSALSASRYPVSNRPSPPTGKLSPNRAPSPMRKASYSYNKQNRENQEAEGANVVHPNSGGSTTTSSESDTSLRTHAKSVGAHAPAVGPSGGAPAGPVRRSREISMNRALLTNSLSSYVAAIEQTEQQPLTGKEWPDSAGKVSLSSTRGNTLQTVSRELVAPGTQEIGVQEERTVGADDESICSVVSYESECSDTFPQSTLVHLCPSGLERPVCGPSINASCFLQSELFPGGVEFVQPVQPVQPVQRVQLVQTVQPVVPLRTVQSVQTVEPVQWGQPTHWQAQNAPKQPKRQGNRATRRKNRLDGGRWLACAVQSNKPPLLCSLPFQTHYSLCLLTAYLLSCHSFPELEEPVQMRRTLGASIDHAW